MAHLELYIVHARQKQNANEAGVQSQEFHTSSEVQAVRRMEWFLADQGYDPKDWDITAHTKAEGLACPELECRRVVHHHQVEFRPDGNSGTHGGSV